MTIKTETIVYNPPPLKVMFESNAGEEVAIDSDLICPVCSEFTFADENEYEAHIKAHYDQEKEPKCLVCGKTFKFMANAVQHTHEHSNRRVGCPHCDKVYKGRQQLRSHINKYHRDLRENGDDERSGTVSKQRASAAERTAGTTAMESVAVVEGVDYECPICNSCFDVEKDYYTHIRDHYKNLVSCWVTKILP